MKPYVSTLLDTLNNDSSKIYKTNDKVGKQPSLTNKGGDDFWNMIGEYVKLNEVTINIVNTDKKVLCCLNKTTCLLDNNNNIKRFTDIFKNSYFEDNISRDKENEDPNDPENTGDNNWSLDFWQDLNRNYNVLNSIMLVIFSNFYYTVMQQSERSLIEHILNDKSNTYIIFTKNK